MYMRYTCQFYCTCMWNLYVFRTEVCLFSEDSWKSWSPHFNFTTILVLLWWNSKNEELIFIFINYQVFFSSRQFWLSLFLSWIYRFLKSWVRHFLTHILFSQIHILLLDSFFFNCGRTRWTKLCTTLHWSYFHFEILSDLQKICRS